MRCCFCRVFVSMAVGDDKVSGAGLRHGETLGEKGPQKCFLINLWQLLLLSLFCLVFLCGVICWWHCSIKFTNKQASSHTYCLLLPSSCMISLMMRLWRCTSSKSMIADLRAWEAESHVQGNARCILLFGTLQKIHRGRRLQQRVYPVTWSAVWLVTPCICGLARLRTRIRGSA